MGYQIDEDTLLTSYSFFLRYRTLSSSGGTVRAISSGTETLLVTRLGVGARFLGSTTCALIKDVAFVDGVLLVTLCRMLELYCRN